MFRSILSDMADASSRMRSGTLPGKGLSLPKSFHSALGTRASRRIHSDPFDTEWFSGPTSLTATIRTATSALGILCVCGCYGVQHFDPGSAPSAAPPPSSSKAAPPASGPAQSAPKVPSFVETARLRKQRQTGQIYEQSFDPSSKIHVESWAKLAPRPEKRKHATGGRAKEGGIKRAATGSAVSSGPTKLAPVVKFTFVLVEKPKMVDEGEYRMPDSGRMTSLYRCGHIRIIEFHPSATPKDIEAIVSDKYSSLPAIVEGKASMFNFVLLSKKPVSRGARPFLIRHKIAGDFDLQDLEWSIQNHRQEKAYKRCIFISLSRWSPDLKLDIDDESEVEFSDSSNDGTHPFVFKEPPSEPMEQDIHADTPEDWSNETAGMPKGGEAWSVPEPVHLVAYTQNRSVSTGFRYSTRYFAPPRPAQCVHRRSGLVSRACFRPRGR
ncbi:hypothetical protein B0H14DRAFT_3128480 [Mycena olivaceomarginata]|nr:hypothetical protein B0H14DRAFT_3128480 [Mycena olivaceomarginata]